MEIRIPPERKSHQATIHKYYNQTNNEANKPSQNVGATQMHLLYVAESGVYYLALRPRSRSILYGQIGQNPELLTPTVVFKECPATPCLAVQRLEVRSLKQLLSPSEWVPEEYHSPLPPHSYSMYFISQCHTIAKLRCL